MELDGQLLQGEANKPIVGNSARPSETSYHYYINTPSFIQFVENTMVGV